MLRLFPEKTNRIHRHVWFGTWIFPFPLAKTGKDTRISYLDCPPSVGVTQKGGDRHKNLLIGRKNSHCLCDSVLRSKLQPANCWISTILLCFWVVLLILIQQRRCIAMASCYYVADTSIAIWPIRGLPGTGPVSCGTQQIPGFSEPILIMTFQ